MYCPICKNKMAWADGDNYICPDCEIEIRIYYTVDKKEQLKDQDFKREYEKQEKYAPDDLADIFPWLERGVYLRVKE